MILGLSNKGLKMNTVRYDKNPFLEGVNVPVGSKNIRVSTLGKESNVLLNQHTGEVTGTHVVAHKKVDTEQFVKLFTSHIALTFELKAAGIKAFGVLLWAVQNKSIGKDEVDIDKFTHEAFLKDHEGLKLSQPTLWRGIAELERAQIIAKTLKHGRYFINPSFVFNGDRVAFTTLIERKPMEEQQELPLQ